MNREDIGFVMVVGGTGFMFGAAFSLPFTGFAAVPFIFMGLTTGMVGYTLMVRGTP